MVTALLFALVTANAPQQAVHVDAMTFAPPQKVATLDKVKGEPTQIAWSPDGKELYVETGKRTRVGTFVDPHHYVVTIADQKIKSVDAPPQWATDYQSWKSNKWAPGDHTFVIDISESQRTERAISAPMGGDLAKGGGAGAGTTSDDIVTAALTSQNQHVITLRLKGEVVGEYVDTQFLPGYTFGWAPQSLGAAIAYARPDGRVGVMDAAGGKKEIADTKDALIPAWSDSGKQIAFVEKDGKKFGLYVTDVK
jgi:hypothetical protein